MLSARHRTFAALLPVAVAMLVALVSAGPAQADHYDRLLAPRSVCSDQLKSRISSDRMERSMRCMHNYARRKVGVNRLRQRSRLMKSSQAKSRDVLDCQNFSHTACGLDAFHWLHEFLYTASGCYSIAENISLGSRYRGNVRHTMSGWLHSDGHRAGLLNPGFRHVGVGVVRGRYKGFNVRVWTAHFGDLC